MKENSEPTLPLIDRRYGYEKRLEDCRRLKVSRGKDLCSGRGKRSSVGFGVVEVERCGVVDR
jgi:hypothetical protein